MVIVCPLLGTLYHWDQSESSCIALCCACQGYTGSEPTAPQEGGQLWPLSARLRARETLAMILTSDSPASLAGDAVVPCRHFQCWLISFASSCRQYPSLEYCYKDWHALFRDEEQSWDTPFLRKKSKSVVSVKGAEGGTSVARRMCPGGLEKWVPGESTWKEAWLATWTPSGLFSCSNQKYQGSWQEVC